MKKCIDSHEIVSEDINHHRTYGEVGVIKITKGQATGIDINCLCKVDNGYAVVETIGTTDNYMLVSYKSMLIMDKDFIKEITRIVMNDTTIEENIKSYIKKMNLGDENMPILYHGFI